MRKSISQIFYLPKRTKISLLLGSTLALLVALPLFVWSIINMRFDLREKAQSTAPSTQNEPYIGPSNAKVTIVEFLDYQCGYCGYMANEIIPQILSTYPNDVRLVIKDYPLTLHPLSYNAALSAECAFRQGKFADMYSLIFSNQTSLTPESFSNFANQIGLDQSIFNECVNGSSAKQAVDQNIAESSSLGLSGTPVFYINDETFYGSTSFEVFNQLILKHLDDVIENPQEITTPTPTTTNLAVGGYVEGEPNSCGGTCGSNNNCKANFVCFGGYCRNPLCTSQTDCICPEPTKQPTQKPTTKPVQTKKPIATIQKSTPTTTPLALNRFGMTESKSSAMEKPYVDDIGDIPQIKNTINKKINWYVYVIYGVSVLFIITLLTLALIKKPKDIPQSSIK